MAQLYQWSCANCDAVQAMTVEANNIYRQNHLRFYCVHGHHNHYPEGESENDRIRRERDYLKQQTARLHDRISEETKRADRERNRANGYKGHATRITNRAKAGVCPCCNRTFAQLARHMASQHPQFTPLADEKEMSS